MKPVNYPNLVSITLIILVRGSGNDILDFCDRELVTLSGGGVEKKMAIIVLVKSR